jgi:hypothetical protein
MTPDDARHGTYAGYRAGCDDDCCRVAHRAYCNRRHRLRGYGKWEPFVDAEPARAHVQHLITSGMPLHHIAAAAGVYPQLLCRLIYGAPAEAKAPTTHLRPDNAQRILSVDLDPSPAAVVDGSRTVELLRALAAHGWSISDLQREHIGTRTGLTYNLARGLRRYRAEQIAVIADTLAAMPPGPSIRARQLASRKGWTTDALWSDLVDGGSSYLAFSDLPDNVAVRRFCDGENVPITREERVEVVRELIRRGVSNNRIGRRLRVNGQTLRVLLDQVSDSPRSMHRTNEQRQDRAA